MAAIDTIVIADGIMHQKETTSDVYTQDTDPLSSVYQKPFYIPLAYKAARVLYNGIHDPDGGRFHYRTKLLRVTSVTTPTKTANQEDAWAILTPASTASAVKKSTAFDVSASFYSVITVNICQSSTDANTTGIEFYIQGRREDSVDEWSNIYGPLNALSLGAATKSDFAAQEAATETVLSITNPTAGNLDHVGKFIFLEDTATINNSEIAFLVECGADS